MTEQEEKDALAALVDPWLPGAIIETLYIQERCGCHSEWTTESPRYEVTFQAPRPTAESDRRLSNVVRVLEGLAMQFAMQHHKFSGCSCCCGDGDGDDGDTSDVRPSLWVRIIPLKVK